MKHAVADQLRVAASPEWRTERQGSADTEVVPNRFSEHCPEDR